MITRSTLLRAVAVPAALTLALGGALLGATAANAADGQLVITSPQNGSTTASRDVDIVGTAAPGAVINVFTDSSRAERLVQTTADRTSGAFTADLPLYPEAALSAQSVFVDGLVGFSGFDEPATVSFRLPVSKFLTVDAPTEDQVFDSRTVTVTGTASEGSTVTVSGASGELGRANLGTSTSYSIPVTFPDGADASQTLTVGGFYGGSGFVPVTRDITIPAPVEVPAPKAVTLDTPAEGATTESRTVTFTGTAPVGSTVTIVGADGTELGRANLGNASTFSIDVVFADDAETTQTVTVGGFVGGSGFDNEIVRTFSLSVVTEPAPEPIVLDAPVFTAPVEGEVVVGDRVTFEGTGTPGADIGVIAVPTAQLAELEDQLAALFPEPQVGTLAQPDPQPAPADPAERIVVGEDGTWTVTIAAVPGDYTAVAVSALLDEDGTVLIDDATGLPVVSAPSEPLEFSIVAAAAAPSTTPAGTTPVASNGSGALAYTGTEAGGVLGLAAALALAGTALVLIARRQRALAAIGADQQ